MPRYRLADLYPEESEQNLNTNNLETTFTHFLKVARDLKQLHAASSMKILIGMETEWIYSESRNQIENLRSQVDYLVGSVHHVESVPIDFSPKLFEQLQTKYGLERVFEMYFDSQFEMLEQIRPEVVGHFDLIRIWTPEAQFSEKVMVKIKRNIKKIVEYGGLVELNSRAFKKGLNGAYPLPDVLKLMIEMDTKFTLSDDSHGPDDVGMHYNKLRNYLSQNGIVKVYAPCANGGVTEYTNILDHIFWDQYN
jgi:histidinol-phosphatase (PHP family)